MNAKTASTKASESAEVMSMTSFLLTGGKPDIPQGKGRVHLMDDHKPGRSVRVPAQGAGDFSEADRELIARVSHYMPHQQLLGIINSRLRADRGEGAGQYSIDQLRAFIATQTAAAPDDDNGWGALRKRIAQARRDGVLAQINEQTIADFAVVFSLTEKQLLTLKDTLLTGEEN